MLYRNKKKNDSNEGKWLGVGGKLEDGETIDECARREVFEETGISKANLVRVGLIHFRSDIYPDEDMYLYVGHIDKKPELNETCEGELKWIKKEKVMELPLWEGDRVFLKDLSEGRRDFEYVLSYSKDKLQKVTKV